MDIFQLIDIKKSELICNECLEFSKFSVDEYVEEILEDYMSVEEGIGDKIKDKFKNAGERIVNAAQKVLELIKKFINKIKEMVNKMIKIFKRQSINQNENRTKTNYTKTENKQEKKKDISDEELYKKYGSKVIIKHLVPQKPNYLDFNTYFSELENLGDEMIDIANDETKHSFSKSDEYRDKLKNIQKKHNAEGIDGAHNISYRIFIPNYDCKNESAKDKGIPMNQFPLDVVRMYTTHGSKQQILDEMIKTTNKVSAAYKRIKNYTENIKHRGEEMQRDIDKIKADLKTELDNGGYKEGIGYTNKATKYRRKKDEKEFAHVKLLSILDAFKSIVIEIGYLQLFCFNGLNAATFACEAVVKNLKLLRKKEMGEKIDTEDEEDI